MLFYRSRWRFAFERNPEREARCLCAKFGDMEDDQVKEMIVDAISEAAHANAKRQKIDEDVLAIVDEFRDEIIGMIQNGDASHEAAGSNQQDPEKRMEGLAQRLHAFTYAKSPELAEAFNDVMFKTDDEGNVIGMNDELILKTKGIQTKVDQAIDEKKNSLKQKCIEYAKTQFWTDKDDKMIFEEWFRQSESKEATGERKIIHQFKDEFVRSVAGARDEKTRDELLQKFEGFLNENTFRWSDNAVNAFIDTLTDDEKRVILKFRKEFVQKGEEFIKKGEADDTEKESRKIKVIAEKIDNLRKMHEETAAFNRQSEVRDLKASLSEQNRQKVENGFELLEVRAQSLGALHDKAARLSEWENMQLKPQAFRSFLERAYADDGTNPSSVIARFDAAMNNPEILEKVKAWDKLNASDKVHIVRVLSDAIGLEGMIGEIKNTLDAWEQYVNDMKQVIEEALSAFRKDEEQKERTKKQSEAGKSIKFGERIAHFRDHGFLGMTLYSPNEVILGVQKVWQAWDEGRKERETQMATRFATSASSALTAMHLPYSDAMNRRLGSIAESEFNKAKNDYKEELGDDDFKTLREKFETVRFDPPKAIAVLEAASEHGWLYDLSDLTDEEWPVKIFDIDFRQVVPIHWDETQQKNYISTLTRKNTAGGNEERQKGHDRIKEQQDPEVYKRKFRSYLNSHNYWAAMGVGEALIERGKMQEVSEFLTVTFMQHLRNNPDGRKYATKTILEQFGNTKWNESITFAQNMVTMNMNDVKTLRRDGRTMSGPLLGTIKAIEEDVIAANGGTLPDDEMSDIVSAIMSGKTVEVGPSKTKISVYNNRYRNYWDESKQLLWGTYNGEKFIKIQTDYYADQTLLQLPKNALEAIFHSDSTGSLTNNKDIALNYAGYAIKKMEELGDSEAGRVFREYIHEKIAPAIKQALTDRAMGQYYQYNWKRGNIEGKPMVASLIAAGFLTRQEVAQMVKDKDKTGLFMQNIDEQLQDMGYSGS